MYAIDINRDIDIDVEFAELVEPVAVRAPKPRWKAQLSAPSPLPCYVSSQPQPASGCESKATAIAATVSAPWPRGSRVPTARSASWHRRTIDEFLRGKRPEGAIVVKANWRDNPFFPAVLEEERRLDLSLYPDRYEPVLEARAPQR